METGKSLTVKYIAALSVIASLLLVTFWSISAQISEQEHMGRVINIAGQQRMLSQRAAFLAKEISELGHMLSAHDSHHHTHHKTIRLFTSIKEEEQKRVTLLQEVRDTMLRNHQELISGEFADGERYVMSDEVKLGYFLEEGLHLDDQVTEYITLLDRLIQEGMKEKISSIAIDALTAEIASRSLEGLLSDLDSMVHQYANENLEANRRFVTIERFALMFGLAILLIEAFFIFRPMIRNIVMKAQALEAANGELRKANKELQSFSYRLMHDVRSPMTSLMSQMELVNKYAASFGNEAVSSLVTKTKNGLDELQQLMDRMFGLVKLKALEIEKQPLDVRKFLEKQAVYYRKEAEGQKVNIQLACEVGVAVSLQEPYFKAAISNSVLHVASYAPSECELPIVSLKVELEGTVLTVQADYVAEEGVGKTANAPSGSPISLYLATEAVEMMEGVLELDPDEAQAGGVCFTVDCAA